MICYIHGHRLAITWQGICYGTIFRRKLLWQEVAEVGFYLEKVKTRDVHYMNFSNQTYLTKPSKNKGLSVLWFCVLVNAMPQKTATAFKQVKGQGGILIPLFKKQYLPTMGFGKQALLIEQAVQTYAGKQLFIFP